ncbi:MAG: hypothetical protein V1734_04285 [Nanoarchaeota archaeon]
MAKKLIWADINKRGRNINSTYYFDFELLNQLGFPDSEMLSFIEEMKTFAEKEQKERAEERQEGE